MPERVFIVAAKRSAIGRYLCSLAQADADDVCAQVIRGGFPEALLRDVRSVIVGNVLSAGLGQGLARQIALRAGLDERTIAYAVNMVCGSGMQAIRCAANEVRLGGGPVLCGGVELMSRAPFAAPASLRTGRKLGDLTLTDLLVHDGLTDAFSGVHMGVTAENVAKACGITREEQDAYATETLRRAIAAVDSGIFREEIVPVRVRDAKGREIIFDTDEQPNRASTPEKVASLRPSFLPDGTVTAASSSGLNDGAAFLVLASESYCEAHGLTPLAELLADTAVGCDPQTMGLGPYYAIRQLLTDSGVAFDAIDRFEINEAFAAQALGCYRLLAREYGVSEEALRARTNLYGSGIGLGHPLGATGARIAVTLAHMLARGECSLGVASLCIGGGMGAALLAGRAVPAPISGGQGQRPSPNE